MSDKLTARIAALLAKAENTDNDHEREAFMDKVQELTTNYQIDLEHVRQAALRLNRPAAVPTTRTIVIGAQGTRGLKTYVALFGSIAYANGLQVDIETNSTKVYPFGFAEDIDLTEAMYNSLLVQMVKASEAYLATGAYLQEKVWVPGHYRKRRKDENPADYWGRSERVWEDSEYRTPNRMTARIAFQMSFAAKVSQRLELAKAHTLLDLEDKAPATGAVIALRDRNAAVELFHKEHSDARGSYWSSRATKHVAGASRAGREAGEHARLGTEQAIGGHRTQLAG